MNKSIRIWNRRQVVNPKPGVADDSLLMLNFHTTGKHKWWCLGPSEHLNMNSRNMEVSWNGGTPKSPVYRWIFLYKPSISGYPHLWNPPNIERPRKVDLSRTQTDGFVASRISLCRSTSCWWSDAKFRSFSISLQHPTIKLWISWNYSKNQLLWEHILCICICMCIVYVYVHVHIYIYLYIYV